MIRKQSLDVLFYGRHENKTFPDGISRSNVFKFIKLMQFFPAESCLSISLILRVLNKHDDF